MTGDLFRQLAAAALAGAATGARSLTGVAALTVATGPQAPLLPDRVLARPAVKVTAGLLAAGEGAADKLPQAPSRLAPAGLSGRLASAAVCGVIVVRRRGGTAAALGSCTVVAVGTAAGTAWLGSRWRRWAAPRLGHDWIAAVIEDAAAVTLAATAARCAAG